MNDIAITGNVKTSFFISYMVLFASTLITFIEAMRTKSVRARHILNLETTVSVVAGYVYFLFLQMLQKKETKLNDITKYRYLDWFITTPMLLLALMLFFNFNSKRDLRITLYLWIVLLNAMMLASGYLGETQRIPEHYAGVLGFVFYIAMLYVMWFGIVRDSNVPHHRNVFIVFGTIWSFYGIAYYLDETKKNIMYNTLDVVSKSIFGLFMWLYYGGVVEI